MELKLAYFETYRNYRIYFEENECIYRVLFDGEYVAFPSGIDSIYDWIDGRFK